MPILLSRFTSLLLRSKPVQRNCLRFLQKVEKTVCALRVNETKVTSINTFIVNLFALGRWKSKTRVMSCELQAQIHELPVQIHELPVQSHELRVKSTSYNPRVRRLKARFA